MGYEIMSDLLDPACIYC